MKRLDRLSAILIRLQSKQIVKARELSDRFDVSLRTIYRDILSLQEAGVPIGSQEGVGYFLVEGYHLPPVMFTEEEANALMLGEKLTSQLTDAGLGRDYQDAMHKIRSVLPGSHKNRLELLNENISVSSTAVSNNDNSVLSIIQKALSLSKVLKIKYYSNYNGLMNQRDIEAIGLVYYADSWHVIAWCRLRKDYRDFRTDRIGKIQILDEQYTRAKHPGIHDYLENIKNQFILNEFIVRFNNDIVRFTERDRFNHGFVEEIKKKEYTEMKFLSPSLDYFARWILWFEDSVEIIQTDELKQYITTIVSRLKNKYPS